MMGCDWKLKIENLKLKSDKVSLNQFSIGIFQFSICNALMVGTAHPAPMPLGALS
jgi:hypothetical protein